MLLFLVTCVAGSGCLDVATCCDYTCGICFTTDTNCVTCSDSNRSLPTCGCDPGWFDDGLGNPVCIACIYPCATCTGSSTNCDTCTGSPANRNANPDCNCIATFYNNSLLGDTCVSCVHPCTE